MLFPFSTNRTVFKQKSSGAMEKPQSFFVSWITDGNWSVKFVSALL
jgi:hypothetical protein